MPELPEVETTCRGIAPYLEGARIEAAVVRQRQLRWPIPADLEARLAGQAVLGLGRRAKFLQLELGCGVLLLHLGMSGSLRLVERTCPAARHDHYDLLLAGSSLALRYTDPRRFGLLLWQDSLQGQRLLQHLGPEPLGDGFDGQRLYRLARGRLLPVKRFIMDNAVVVGVGNIYANEALFAAGIDPRRAAGRISLARCQALAAAIKAILAAAIAKGGTTLRNFVGGDGKPGYFQQQLYVYGRAGQPCKRCGTTLREQRIGQRSSVFCPNCQH